MCSTAYSPVLRKRQCVLMIFDFRPHRMHRIHAHYCNRRRTFRGLSVCVCVAHADLNPAKSAEPIEMPFGNRFMYTQGTVY